jgi:membrane protein YqaA with SNARE-associated domain
MIWNNLLILISIALFVFVLVAFLILRKKESRNKLIIFLFIIALLFCIYFLRNYIIDFLKGIPILWALIGPIISEVQKGSLLGLFYLVFLGSLFFISIPAEFSILYYLSLGHNPILVIAVTILGNILGLTVDYFFGRLFGESLIRFFVKNKFDGLKGLLDKIGGGVLLVGNILPVGTELIVLVVGSIKYNFKKFLIYSLVGMTIKYCGMFFLKNYLIENLLPKAKGYFGSFLPSPL